LNVLDCGVRHNDGKVVRHPGPGAGIQAIESELADGEGQCLNA